MTENRDVGSQQLRGVATLVVGATLGGALLLVALLREDPNSYHPPMPILLAIGIGAFKPAVLLEAVLVGRLAWLRRSSVIAALRTPSAIRQEPTVILALLLALVLVVMLADNAFEYAVSLAEREAEPGLVAPMEAEPALPPSII